MVTGRWATKGGGGLQIPKAVRGAVCAEPGYRLAVADAAQLEPRILAALSKDVALQSRAATEADLYTALAEVGFDGQRHLAKSAMLGSMYGQTTGEGGRLVPVLRRQYPAAMGLLEQAAQDGQAGRPVRRTGSTGCVARPGPGAVYPEFCHPRFGCRLGSSVVGNPTAAAGCVTGCADRLFSA